MFWEKIFFFSTREALFFMQITQNDLILIKIANSMGNNEKRGAVFDYDDL